MNQADIPLCLHTPTAAYSFSVPQVLNRRPSSYIRSALRYWVNDWTNMTSEVMPTASPADFKEPRTIFNPTTCTRKGLCPVTEINHQGGDPLESHSLYYEVHGSGPEKVVFIMGYVVLTLVPMVGSYGAASYQPQLILGRLVASG